MNKKILLLVILILFFSIGSIHANDINVTDDATLDSVEDISIQTYDKDSILDETAKNQTEFTSSQTSTYGYYNVTLKDLNTSGPLPAKQVDFTLNAAKYSNVTDDNGVADIKLNLNPGTYTVVASFLGDSTHSPCNITSKLTVLPTVKASNVNKYYKGSAKYTATFLDNYGNPLKNTLVKITVNGKSYSKKTNNKGIATLAMNYNPGTYRVVAINPVTGYESATTFKILSTISSGDLKKVKGDSRKFVAKFFKSSGKPLANKAVKVKVNGIVKKVKTNSKGKVKLSLNNLKKGTYKVICYNNDGLSKSQTVKVYNIAKTKLTVNTSSFHTFLPNDTRTVKIKLSTSLGGDSKSGKTVKIKLNGKTYSRKTDSKGVINFNLPENKGFFTVTYSYGGDKFFKSSEISNQITLLETTKTTLKVKGTSRFGYGANTLLMVAYTAGDVPLAKKKVTFTINGKTYTNTTNNNGIACVPITLNLGTYTISYKTSSDSYVEGTSASSNITVFTRSPSKLTWKSGTVYKDNLQTFKVLLTNSKGEPISGGNIELVIDGETYTGKTASNGYATIKTAVALGKYTVSVKFTGSNDYLPSSTSKSITVKLSKFGNGLNQKSGSASSSYLSSSSYCQVSSAKIKAAVKSLTAGLTDKIDKAKALFNFVRDNIEYSYYYNSHKGAVGTLNAKKGNCADQAHLLVALYRAAGFKARYVHGVCKFSDGTFGHVWTQVLIDGTWVCGDPISYKNSLGKINNWNTNSYGIHSKYQSLPF